VLLFVYTKQNRGDNLINIPELKAAMARKGYTQKRLASELNMTEQRLARLIKKGTLGVEDATKIINILCIEDPVPIFLARK
jgi:transcriptional regulator with XRE-family HTH domain